MIRRCVEADFPAIEAIINEAAQAYKGVIPADRWHEPYMSAAELRTEMAAGVQFWGCDADGALAGVMGIQHVEDVTLIRHAYIRTTHQQRGIGSLLLAHLRVLTNRPVLIGTWAAAVWAIRFYQKHGFRVVPGAEKEGLLRRYWKVPERQAEVSVVLTDSGFTLIGSPPPEALRK